MKNRKKLFAFIICMLLVLPVVAHVGKTKVVYASVTGMVTATSLNVRTGPSTNNKIAICNRKNVSLKKGEKVTVIKEEKKWYYIECKYNGLKVKGYVLAEYIKTDGKVTNSGTTNSGTSTTTATTKLKYTATVNATSLKVRKSAGMKSAQLEISKQAVYLKNKAKVTILSETIKDKQNWYKVSFSWGGKTKTGYVLSDYIVLDTKKTITASISSTTSVKIRTGAGDKKAYLKVSDKVVSLKKGTKLKITGETTVSGKKWFKVSFTYSKKTRVGYLLADTVVLTENTTANDTVKPENPTDDSLVDVAMATSNLRVRKGAGTNYAQLAYKNGDNVTLLKDKKAIILSQKKVDNVIWYQITFTANQETVKGYVSGDYVKVAKEKPDGIVVSGEVEDPEPEPEKPEDDQDQSTPGTALSDEEFEASMEQQGFPEDYKPYLRELHKQYPYWQFEAYHTGLDWNSVIEKQSGVGKNLITNNKNISWKSLESKAYDWLTDKFIVYDGTTWVTASKAAIEYYMDPRNFLTANGIFQFESLNYKKDYQNVAGVENILKNTPMYNTSYTYKDSDGIDQTITYAETFIKAAEYSDVNPYHLATRVKQEVVTGSTSFSSSVTGTVAGYEGYYNFYNIGATHSAGGGAVANALNYAKNGTVSALTNALYMIPWNNRYSSIVGGSQFIGSSYISRGQNTIYLQKFNVTPKSTHSHQYMANVEAPYAESKKTYAAYSQMSDVPIVFSIPVYSNMPGNISPIPVEGYNPNNWLKTLKVDGYSLTPTFDPMNNQSYTLIVGNDISTVNLTATTVSNKATIINGTGTIPLVQGNNEIAIDVQAENGEVRRYTLIIFKE